MLTIEEKMLKLIQYVKDTNLDIIENDVVIPLEDDDITLSDLNEMEIIITTELQYKNRLL